MALELLVICVWDGARKTGREVHHPSWADVEQAIRDDTGGFTKTIKRSDEGRSC